MPIKGLSFNKYLFRSEHEAGARDVLVNKTGWVPALGGLTVK